MSEVISERALLSDPEVKAAALDDAASEALADCRVFFCDVMNMNGSIPRMPDYTHEAYDPLFDAVKEWEEVDGLLLQTRETGKTTFIKGWTLWKGLRDPDLSILLTHAKFKHACSWVGTIKAWMLGGYRQPDQPGSDLRLVFGPYNKLPPLGTKQWGTMDSIVFPGRKVTVDEPTVQAAGMDNIVTGYHFDIVVGDDLVNRENYRSPDQIDQIEDWVRLTPALLTGKRRRIFVGTRWPGRDLLGRMIDEDDAKAEAGKPRSFHACIMPARKPDGTPRFAHKGEEQLQQMFVDMGPTQYAAQVDLSPLPGGMQPLKEEYFTKNFYRLSDIGHREGTKFVVNEEFHVAIFVDLAASLEDGADRTAIIVRASDPRGHIYILEAQAGHWLPSEVFARLTRLQRQYDARYIGCEKGPLRAAYAGSILNWNADHRSHPIVFAADIEVGGGKNRGVNDRILSLEAPAAAGMIHLLPDQKDLLYELVSYPNHPQKKDDLADTAALCVLNPYRTRVRRRDADVVKSSADLVMDWWRKKATAMAGEEM